MSTTEDLSIQTYMLEPESDPAERDEDDAPAEQPMTRSSTAKGKRSLLGPGLSPIHHHLLELQPLCSKLGQQAKQAAMTKASTSQLSPLIRKRSTSKAETSATITQGKSHVPTETCEGIKASEGAETSAGVSLNHCEAGVDTGRDVKVTHEENKGLMHTENMMRGKEEHRGGGGLSSLVADYISDSASDSEH